MKYSIMQAPYLDEKKEKFPEFPWEVWNEYNVVDVRKTYLEALELKNELSAFSCDKHLGKNNSCN